MGPITTFSFGDYDTAQKVALRRLSILLTVATECLLKGPRHARTTNPPEYAGSAPLVLLSVIHSHGTSLDNDDCRGRDTSTLAARQRSEGLPIVAAARRKRALTAQRYRNCRERY